MKIAVKFLLVLSIILVSFFLWLNMGTSSPILWNTGKESVQEQEKKDKEKAKDKEQTVHITRRNQPEAAAGNISGGSDWLGDAGFL